MFYTSAILVRKMPARVQRDLDKALQIPRESPKYQENTDVNFWMSGTTPTLTTTAVMAYRYDPKHPSGGCLQILCETGSDDVLVEYTMDMVYDRVKFPKNYLTAAQWRVIQHECRKWAHLLLEYKFKWVAGFVVSRPEPLVRVWVHVNGAKNCRVTVVDDLESEEEIRSHPSILVPLNELRDL